MHGGKGSGAPNDNRNAFKKGLFTRALLAREKKVAEVRRAARALFKEFEDMA